MRQGAPSATKLSASAAKSLFTKKSEKHETVAQLLREVSRHSCDVLKKFSVVYIVTVVVKRYLVAVKRRGKGESIHAPIVRMCCLCMFIQSVAFALKMFKQQVNLAPVKSATLPHWGGL